MNGRCDNDPLDPADNVCDLCGGDYCSSCLITPKGRKKPWCKKCALDRSGVRGGVKTQKKSSKRDARNRRKELTETRGEREDGRFVFFDEPESEFEIRDLGEPEPEESADSRRRKVSLGIRKNKNEQSTEDGADDAPPAADVGTYVASDSPAPPQADNAAAAASVPPPTAADAIAPEPSSTELLARLQDHLPESVTQSADSAPGPSSSSMPSLDSTFDPTFDPFAMPNEPAGLGDEPESFDSFDAVGGFDAPTDDVDNFGSASSFDFDDTPPPPPAGPQAEPDPFDQPSEQASPQPSLLDRLGGEHASAVSRVAPVSEAEFLRAEQDQGEYLGTDAQSPEAISFEPVSYESETFEPDSYEPEIGGKGEDTDEDGNWIPPALRGMAPVEVRESLSLPKRGRV